MLSVDCRECDCVMLGGLVIFSCNVMFVRLVIVADQCSRVLYAIQDFLYLY